MMKVVPGSTLQDPGILHLAAAGDVYDVLAGNGYPRQGAGDYLHDAQVFRVSRQRDHPVVGVRVPKNKATFPRLTEHVGRKVDQLLRYVLNWVALDHSSEAL